MRKKSSNKRICGATLELIMRDVLYGIQAYTSDASQNSPSCLDVLSVKREPANNQRTARIIPFRKLKVN